MQFLAFLVLFLAYMSVAVYGNEPSWTTSDLIAHPQGRAALALECILMIMMFGQVCCRQNISSADWVLGAVAHTGRPAEGWALPVNNT